MKLYFQAAVKNRRNRSMNTKKLGFGLMRLPVVNEDDKSKVDIESVAWQIAL